ncbi:MAG: DUF2156 domain-containing protein [Oscillospiraceae bacterium]|nr:DUF2156 domain-containing protein [Oscillospiraceae bacterium]
MLFTSPLLPEDYERFAPAFLAENSECSELSFNTTYLWQGSFASAACMHGSRLILKSTAGHHCAYSFPIGGGELAPAIDAISEDAAENGCPLVIRCITPENRQKLEDAFPGRFVFSENRDAFEYVYTAEALAELSGKKLHAKRNHINRFISEYDWSFAPLTPADIPECRSMSRVWASENEGKSGIGFYMDLAALETAFRDYEKLSLIGGVLRVSGKIAAFTIGSKINTDTFDVHFEKAFTGIDGAYTMINREFVRYVRSIMPDIKYINREDDMGSEGLRKAKLSYHPDHMVLKYTAREK